MQGDNEFPHQPVLPAEVLQCLSPEPGCVMLDGTLGLGGHASLILPKIMPGGIYIGLDRDESSLLLAKARLASYGDSLRLFQARFSDFQEALTQSGVDKLDLALLDIGVSSPQLDDPQRGFSFSHYGPLDMRMSAHDSFPAAHYVATMPEKELADIIYKYGEERFSRRIAKTIAESRRKQPITTTGQLADLVRKCIPGFSKIDKATRTFQALRIFVNDELGELERALAALPGALKPGARLAVISFHSLEDRIVKQCFRAWEEDDLVEVLTPKPVTAGEAEMNVNPRSRSAKLRAVRWK